MLTKIKEKIEFYIRVKIFHENSMDIKINKGRASGIKIGERCHIYSELPRRNDVCLLEIGNDVTISGG